MQAEFQTDVVQVCGGLGVCLFPSWLGRQLILFVKKTEECLLDLVKGSQRLPSCEKLSDLCRLEHSACYIHYRLPAAVAKPGQWLEQRPPAIRRLGYPATAIPSRARRYNQAIAANQPMLNGLWTYDATVTC
ncbi:hypothetical protein [Chitiniphilus eburneus]|uniref:Uncharacterized protein n=1 Tax=Chitiniphilus eburneus TaxID=2571148 RepID=A0A4V5MQK9_9NEIS|nr:hypothetical protein [Chitiniphilus eburneus]TJZ72938.1 hypothetical protein FAZ21_12015 [Chitiniphilus eburneus]